MHGDLVSREKGKCKCIQAPIDVVLVASEYYDVTTVVIQTTIHTAHSYCKIFKQLNVRPGLDNVTNQGTMEKMAKRHRNKL
ncbi:hypothetical protein HHI36_006817 [Cryptolaemus montrouzieri]|uniref:Uncharacterized protein n=1 Tax=Cryptolaemus montrouzieri TaxID=559131 RepID=A0ABD2MMY0_9CUCU